MAKSKLVVPVDKVVEFIEPFEKKNLFGKFNKACVIGRVMKEFEFSHEYGGNKYYKTIISSRRASGVVDNVPVIVNDKQMSGLPNGKLTDKFIEVAGRYRSYRIQGRDSKIHLELALLAANIKEVDGDDGEDTNVVFLEGTIGKEPSLKETPTNRTITDFFVNVTKSYTRSDFIPCIAWERIALYVSKLKPGDKVKVFGRIQSRKYVKWIDREALIKEAYEVSVWRLIKEE